ncbi:glycosyltransferase family 2 protein [Actinomycetospora sp. C-140]
MISAVVVYHSDLERLTATVASLRHQVDELIVIDVSPSGGAAGLPASDTVVLSRPANEGYGWACNIGITESNGDVVLISNADILYEDGAIAALARAARSGGLCAPLQTTHRDSRLPEDTAESLQLGISIAASANRWLGLGRRRFAARRSELLTDLPELLAVPTTMTLSGASLMASRATWDEVGGFDERFFLYQEDADLTVRCHELGVPVHLVAPALTFHESGSSRGGFDRAVLRWAMTSELSAWRAHHLPRPVLWLIQRVGLLIRAAHEAARGNRRHAHEWMRLVRTQASTP